MANTVLESQNSFQTTDHLHIQNQYTNPPVQHRSFHVGPRLTINMVQNILKQPFLQFFKTVTVNGIFTPMIHLIPVIQSALPATCLNHFNWMFIGFKKLSALAGDNFQNLIICEGIFIDRYRLIGGIISL